MKDEEKITPLHWHEALDRCCLLQGYVEEDLLDHPAIQSLPEDHEIRVLVDRAAEDLATAYQMIGTHTYELSKQK